VIDALAAINVSSPGADQTGATNLASSGGANIVVGRSYQAGADGGVMSWTLGASVTWAIIAASMKPAASGTEHTGEVTDGGEFGDSVGAVTGGRYVTVTRFNDIQ
jgi:hypothetical protein